MKNILLHSLVLTSLVISTQCFGDQINKSLNSHQKDAAFEAIDILREVALVALNHLELSHQDSPESIKAFEDTRQEFENFIKSSKQLITSADALKRTSNPISQEEKDQLWSHVRSHVFNSPHIMNYLVKKGMVGQAVIVNSLFMSWEYFC